MTQPRVAIITGGTRGIGKAISKALIADKYKVCAFFAHNEQAAKAFKAETGATALKVNVTDYGAVERAVKKVEKELGDIAVLVNNAGITRDGTLHKMPVENWHDVIETNLTSCFHLCHAVIKGMRARKHGRIINISSINGQKGQFGQTNYSAAKAGMIGFTKALALESAIKGITVNAICPGYIETDMTAAIPSEVLDNIVRQIPTGRMGRTSEIAALVSYLVSDAAAFMTGATLSINGGQYMV
jgi:acetoacetyl-CoA reductase